MTKFLLFPVAFLMLLSCAQSQKKTTDVVEEVRVDCPAYVKVGFVKICLPEIDSMVESYTDSIIKIWADNHELKGNTILSFFTRNPTVVGRNAEGETTYDDFFKIYQVDNLQNMNVDPPYLDEVANSISTKNTFSNWEETQKKLQTDINFLPIAQPYFIEQYSPHPNVRSFVILYKFNPGGFESVLIGVMNIVLIKRRMFGLTYYKSFMGAQTLTNAKAKNNLIISKLMAANGE